MRHKYNARKTVVDGIKFDSKKEAARYQELKLLEQENAIENLRLQVPYELIPNFIVDNKKFRGIKYVADFVYTDTATGEEIIEDVKGFKKDKVFLIKQKLFAYFIGKEIKIT